MLKTELSAKRMLNECFQDLQDSVTASPLILSSKLSFIMKSDCSMQVEFNFNGSKKIRPNLNLRII